MSSDDWMNRLYDGDVLYGNGDTENTVTATLPASSQAHDFPAGDADTLPGREIPRTDTETCSGKNTGKDSEEPTREIPTPAREADTEKLPVATEPDGADDQHKGTPGLRQRLAEAKARKDALRKQVSEKTALVSARIKPVRDTVASSLERKRWSFLWAMCFSWLIGIQFLVALWDRVMLIIELPQLVSGSHPMGFGLLHGPGRWFRDTLADHWENGGMGRLLLAAVCGIAPLLLAAAHGEKKKLGRLYFYGLLAVPTFYLIGVSYWGWPLEWTDIYVACLSGTAWYCTLWAKEKEPGFTRMLLMVPLASVVSGALAYSPGAAF